VKSFGIKQAESKEQELTASMKENIENTIKEPIIQ
jgi:hypothetical protein